MTAPWPVPAALPGERVAVEGGGPRLALQLAQAVQGDSQAPLLMLHGMDAAASSAMLAPLFGALAAERTLAAPDLPGFGASAQETLVPDPRMLVRAALRSAAQLRLLGVTALPDLLAVGDACELAALAAVAAPRAFRSVILVSPTGLEASRAEVFSDGATQAHPLARAVAGSGTLAHALLRAATAGPLLGAHLRRQWGAAALDAAWLAHARACLQAPGAWHGALAWATGALATRGIAEVMARIALPVWVAHGRRAPASELGALARIGPPSNWSVRAFDTGPLPFREAPREFTAGLRAFAARAAAASAPTRRQSPRRQSWHGGFGTLSSSAVMR